MKIPKFMLRGFSRPSDAIIASLGSLERDTMREVWRQTEASVQQISAALTEQIAYTTVMTTLDRLYKKGLLHRRKQGRAFLSSACAFFLSPPRFFSFRSTTKAGSSLPQKLIFSVNRLK